MAYANTNNTRAKTKLSITSDLLQKLQNHVLFAGQPSEDPYEHVQNFVHVCRSIMGTQHPAMPIVGQQVFPMTLIGNVTTWYS